MQCSKTFTLTVDAVTTCCLVDTTSIVTASAAGGMCYVVTDNRIFAALLNDVVVIDPATDTVIGTIVGVTASSGTTVYSPVNNRVYIMDPGALEVQVINPTLMTHIATITPPVGVVSFGAPSYDETNDLIYLPGTTATDNIIMVLDPLAGTITTLITQAFPGLGFQSFNFRVAHCTFDNRIYTSFYNDNGLGSTLLTLRAYSIAGALDLTIPIPGAVSGTAGTEQMYWSTDTGFLYLLADTAITDTPGAVVIDPASSTAVGGLSIGANTIVSMGFAPDCQSVNILTDAGTIMQFDSVTHASICTTDLTSIMTSAVQMATAANGNVYAPDLTSVTVHSLHVPP